MISLGKFLVHILALFFRVSIKGMENVPEEGAALLCSNHLSGFDMFFTCYKLKRNVYYMAKQELFDIPVIGFIIRKLGAFPVKRGMGDKHAIETAYEILDRGDIVGIYPEGTRRKPGKKVKAGSGAILIAGRKNVPIVPVCIKSSYKIFSKVEIVFGKPYFVDYDVEKKYTNDELHDLSNQLMDKIYSLIGE